MKTPSLLFSACFFVTSVLHLASTDPILVSIFYETLCPDSIRFITRQFYPTYTAFGGFGNAYLGVEFVPYGKARTTDHGNGTFGFECQHGPKECSGNMMHACALDKFPAESIPSFIDCSMSSSNPPTSGPACSNKLGLDFGPVESCIVTQGPSLLATLGTRTHALEPTLTYVPWLLFNGIFSQEDLEQSRVDFMGVVCAKLDNSTLPPPCLSSNKTV